MNRMPKTGRLRTKYSQAGTTAVEFAIIAALFFSMVFGIIELLRLMYVENTLQEVTRRAAALAIDVYPNDDSALASIRQKSIFRQSQGALALAPSITDNFVRLDYLAYDLSPISKSSLPICAAQNQLVCMSNPHAANCIRFVRAQICDPSSTDTCQNASFKLIFPLADLAVQLPTAPTISAVETLGYQAGTPPCSVPGPAL